MIHKTATINWHEGLFIRPHHFQAADAGMAFRESEQAAGNPFFWGLSSLVIDEEALRGYRFRIHSGGMRLGDGTWINIPGNAAVSVKPFKEELLAADHSLPVWAGVRKVEPHMPAVHRFGEESVGGRRPFVIREVEIRDENIGDNGQVIQVKLWSVHIFLGQHPGDDYEAVKIAEIIRSPHTGLPMVDPAHIPPVTSIGACAGLKEKLRNLAVHLNNQATFLRREVAEKRGGLLSDPVKILSMYLRLQAMASFGLVLSQLQVIDEIHPLQLYIELSRLAGSLAPISANVPLEIPEYDHDNLTMVMERLMAVVWSMLEGGIVPEFVERPFEVKRDRRICRIDREWLESEFAAYMCISTEIPEYELDAILSDLRVKIGPSSRIDTLLAERRRGLACPRIRRVPMGLQDRSGLHYFQVDLSRRSEFWDDFRKDLILEIRGIPGNVVPEMKLYVHTESGKQPQPGSGDFNETRSD